MRKIIQHSIVTIAVAVASFGPIVGAPSRVAAEFIRLDNHANGGTINTGVTNNNISVYVKFCGSAFFTLIDSRPIPNISESNDYSWTATSTTTYHNVDEIKITTDGNDWFWLDQLELYGAPFGSTHMTLQWTHGVDNTGGWCFSTEPSDGSDAVCDPDGSRISFTYNVPSPNCG